MRIYIQFGVEKLCFDVEQNYEISLIKEKIMCRTGIPLEKQRLLYDGSLIKDDQTIESAKIKDGAHIILTMDLRGGF